ncbi:MAG: hypothetical protein AAB787_01175 [Patescibacteria group bacterium]
MQKFELVVIQDEVELTADNINFGLELRRLNGDREGKECSVCRVDRYTPGFVVRYRDGAATRCRYYSNFVILAGQQVRMPVAKKQ